MARPKKSDRDVDDAPVKSRAKPKGRGRKSRGADSQSSSNESLPNAKSQESNIAPDRNGPCQMLIFTTTLLSVMIGTALYVFGPAV